MKDNFFGYENLAHLLRIQERHRHTLLLLKSAHYHPLSSLRILDVGCGNGNMLRQFLQWGALPQNLFGIELRREPVDLALELNPNLDIRCASAVQLPWADGSFDLVCQHTMFTSILDMQMKKKIASEMMRVLNPDGAILWYDFMYDNPRNQDVKGIKLPEINSLFPGFSTNIRHITLAPPIARRIPSAILPICYPLLASLRLLCTHYLILISKDGQH